MLCLRHVHDLPECVYINIATTIEFIHANLCWNSRAGKGADMDQRGRRLAAEGVFLFFAAICYFTVGGEENDDSRSETASANTWTLSFTEIPFQVKM